MNRLALAVVAAATAALGTACGNSCPSGTTLVSWTGFDGPGAAVDQSCTTAGVASVNIWLDDQFVGNWGCTDYSAAIPGVPAGGNLLDVEGLAADGRTILFRDSLAYTQPGCADTALQATPGAGTVALDYTFAPTNACFSPGTYIWVAVRDDIAASPAFVDRGTLLCDVAALAPTYDLPNGSYTLLGIEEVLSTAGNAVVGADCTDRRFTIASSQVTTVSPVLVDSSTACF